MEAKIEITNLKEIKRAFAKSPVIVATEMNSAIQKSIFLIERESKIRTPVDTGRLRASHRSRFTNLKGIIGPTVDYAVYVHQGTRFMPGRPFLYEAVHGSVSRVQQFFTDALRKALDRIVRDI